MARTGVTSAAVPVTNTSCASRSSSGLMCRSVIGTPRFLARSMTVRRVMPLRKQSGVGVWISPSMTRNRLAPVVSAR